MNWLVVGTIAGPIVGAAIGIALAHLVEKRPRLLSYYGHVSSFKVRGDEQTLNVHTHDVVIRNSGRLKAHNVRIGHNYFPPDVNVWPDTQHTVESLPDGGREIVFPALVPGEQVTISYMYYPPTLWSHINTYVKSDEGFAKHVAVLLQPQYPRWVRIAVAVLTMSGAIAVVYAIFEIAANIIRA